jgi:hypothetical protein
VAENNDEVKEGEERLSTPSRSNCPSVSARHVAFLESFLNKDQTDELYELERLWDATCR